MNAIKSNFVKHHLYHPVTTRWRFWVSSKLNRNNSRAATHCVDIIHGAAQRTS
jgi:hypothetical protein